MAYSKRTYKLMEYYSKHGYRIHCGNNPRMDQTKKWANFHLVRICQTNSPRSGFSKHTVWASKPKQWRIAFLGWENPRWGDLTGYHPDYYAHNWCVDYPGRYTTKTEAEVAMRQMQQPDPFGVYPDLAVVTIDTDDTVDDISEVAV